MRNYSSKSDRLLTEIKRLFVALENLVSPEAIGSWLKDPNPAFDGSTPYRSSSVGNPIGYGGWCMSWSRVNRLRSPDQNMKLGVAG